MPVRLPPTTHQQEHLMDDHVMTCVICGRPVDLNHVHFIAQPDDQEGAP